MTVFPLTLSILLGAVAILWVVSLILRDASIVDIFWGLGFAVVAAIGLWSGETTSRYRVFAVLAIVWGLRLAIYLAWRNWGKGEDPRYQALRRKYGARFPLLSLFLVFGFQGLLIWVISWPLQVLAGQSWPWTIYDSIGVTLWFIGFAFESIGDWQLARFKARPENRGKVLDRGLWALTRHPNYFGDALLWWGLALPAIAGGAWWTILGPIAMTYLLMKFSGVPLLEKSLVETRPGYRDYIQRTNAFFPWPPRRD